MQNGDRMGIQWKDIHSFGSFDPNKDMNLLTDEVMNSNGCLFAEPQTCPPRRTGNGSMSCQEAWE